MKLKFYSDPGHGWAAVKRQLLVELNLLNRISSYSYQKGNTVYLEEDCDAPCLLQALSVQRQKSVTWIHRQTDRRSPIRNYEPFRP